METEEVEDTPAPISAPRPGILDGVDIGLLGMALAKISQRFVIALSHLFNAAAIGSAFWIFYSISAAPSVNQIVLSALYGVFVLSAIALKETHLWREYARTFIADRPRGAHS